MLAALIEFGGYLIGSVHLPYQTFRAISYRRPYIHFVFIGGLIILYLMLSSLAKGSLRANPFFLTKSLLIAGVAISFSYIFTSFLIYSVAGIFKKKGRLAVFMLLWSFSLLPTLAWFLITTIFYVLLPPPRTYSLKGQLFSGIFLTFSIACFFWKGILYYLSLRIGLLLTAKKIMIVSWIILPVIFVYAYILYRLGIFGVPFI